MNAHPQTAQLIAQDNKASPRRFTAESITDHGALDELPRAERLIAEAKQSAAAYGEGANWPHQVGYLRATVRSLCAEMEPIKETPHDKLRRLVRELIAACEAADAPNCDGMDTVLDRLDEAKESLEEVTWADLDEMYAAFVECEHDRSIKQRMELQPAFGRHINAREES